MGLPGLKAARLFIPLTLCVVAESGLGVLNLNAEGTNAITHVPDSATGSVPNLPNLGTLGGSNPTAVLPLPLVLAPDLLPSDAQHNTADPTNPPLVSGAFSQGQGGLGARIENNNTASIRFTPGFVSQFDPDDTYAGLSSIKFDFDATFRVEPLNTTPGDVNLDCAVNNLDVTPFTQALVIGGDINAQTNVNTFLAQVPQGSFANADANENTMVDNLDITTFTGLVAAGATSDGAGAIENAGAEAEFGIDAVVPNGGSAQVSWEFHYTDPSNNDLSLLANPDDFSGSITYLSSTTETDTISPSSRLANPRTKRFRLEECGLVQIHGFLELKGGVDLGLAKAEALTANGNDDSLFSMTLPTGAFVGLVPEPSSLALLVLGGLTTWGRRRHSDNV